MDLDSDFNPHCNRRPSPATHESSQRHVGSQPWLPTRSSVRSNIPSHPHTLAPSHHTLTPSHTHTFAYPHPRTLVPSHPHTLAPSNTSSHPPTHPHTCSTLASSHPCTLTLARPTHPHTLQRTLTSYSTLIPSHPSIHPHTFQHPHILTLS